MELGGMLEGGRVMLIKRDVTVGASTNPASREGSGKGQWGHSECDSAMFYGLKREFLTLRRQGTHFPISAW